MKTNASRMLSRALPLLFSVVAALAAHAGDAFDFGYRSAGENDLKPVQAFDDGERTYLQMKGALVPVVLASVDGKMTMLQVKNNGQYLVVPAITNKLTLQFANLSAKVTYTGAGRNRTVLAKDAVLRQDMTPVEPSPGAMSSRVKFAATVYGSAKPLIGDPYPDEFIDRDALIPFAKGKSQVSKIAAAKLVLALAGSGTVVKVVITGRDDQVYLEGLARARAIAMRDRILAAGVPIERIVLKEGLARDNENDVITSDIMVTWRSVDERTTRHAVPVVVASVAPAPSMQPMPAPAKASAVKWLMAKNDQNISTVLSKWAASEGWSLIWKASQDIPVTGDATLIAESLLDAVNVVVAQANKIGYPLAVEVNNKVLTIK
ncbi:hypothetical protein Rfer_4251 (plasmid) [Rhodoferax ferrireducens T118]|uniref:Toxin co-regulated pilus biosynthesis protein Q C-terminal domain-containing protein n=1 Tax=Albidiferax ferrireducens (strain ATCC BAA-621 / DSM 15236 / T118) TaxID=338969 RepID=Q21QK7_ALBFT|nr:TcpQ domain-containing protein [Rhodoferax ferrireducens]ABD71938.1 hypothetical protein Rfer_4251 [Rhodoferax ferrireducens T118]